MNPFRRLLIWAVVHLGGPRMIRLIANVFELRKSAKGHFGFPFIKRRCSKSAQILVYHRVNDERDPIFPGVPTNVFTEQMEYVAENYTVCSLSEIVERLRSNELTADLLTLTFDDGYRDNYLHAFPILKGLGLPATIFLATDAIGTGRMLWQDRVFSAFRMTQMPILKNMGDDGRDYPLRTGGELNIALAHVLKFLWSLDDDAKSVWIDKLVERLGVTEQQNDDQLMLNWEHVKTMSEQKIEFGSHTVSHPILSKVTARRARDEIEGSKQLIESKIGLPVRHFAYPVGRAVDFTQPIKNLLRDAGYQSAVTTISGRNDAERDLFELRRATPWDQDINSFALRLSQFQLFS
jgi:peptidoglycan/xylan/chitin deacetylase (PgdA/CDA1 family)